MRVRTPYGEHLRGEARIGQVWVPCDLRKSGQFKIVLLDEDFATVRNLDTGFQTLIRRGRLRPAKHGYRRVK